VVEEIATRVREGKVKVKDVREALARHKAEPAQKTLDPSPATPAPPPPPPPKPTRKGRKPAITSRRPDKPALSLAEREKAALKARAQARNDAISWWVNAGTEDRRAFAEHVTLKNFVAVLPRPEPVYLAELVDDPKATGLFRCLSQVISPELEDRDRIEAADGLIRLIEDTGDDAITVISAIVNTIVEASRALECHG
jgi:hypothetical protein